MVVKDFDGFDSEISQSLDEILEDFKPSGSMNRADCRPLTIWIPVKDKGAYDDIQKKTAQSFTEPLRRVVVAAIKKASRKVS